MRVCIYLFLIFCTLTSYATTTWIGGNGDWENPANWDTGNIPGASDEVVLANGSVNLNTNVSVRSLLVENSTTFIINPSGQLTVLPSTVVVFPVLVRGKVNILGRLQVLNQLGFTGDYHLKMEDSGLWQTDPSGTVTLDGAGIWQQGASSSFNNRGALTITGPAGGWTLNSINSTFINGHSGQIDISSVTTVSAYAVFNIGLFGSLINHGTIAVTSVGQGIQNSGRIYNTGNLLLDGLRIANTANATIENRYSGLIQQDNVTTPFTITQQAGARIKNWGRINISNSSGANAMRLSGRLDNYRSGRITLNGNYSYGQVRLDSDGRWYNHGRLNCGTYNTNDSYGLDNRGDFQNRAGGRVEILGNYQYEALKNSGDMRNQGYLLCGDRLLNESLLENSPCGEIVLRDNLINTSNSVWLNNGLLRWPKNASFSNNGYFQHTAVIEDPHNNIDPNDIVNDGVLAQTKIQPVYLGDNPDFLILGDWWQVATDGLVYHEPEGAQIGVYNPSTNVFTASQDAEGLKEVYFLAEDLNGGCTSWFKVNIDNGIMDGPAPFVPGGDTGNMVYELQLYPNPTTDVLQLRLPAEGDDQVHHWSLYNLQGSEVQRGTIAEGELLTQIHLTDLPASSYLLHLQDEQGRQIATERIMKQ